MIPGLVPGSGFFSSPHGGPVSFVPGNIVNETANQTTYPYPGLIFAGDPHPTRQLVLALYSRTAGGTNGLVTPPTINGDQFTELQSQGGGTRRIWLFSKLHPSGFDGDFVFDFANEQEAIGFIIVCMYGAQIIPHQSSQNNTNPNQTNTLDIPEGGGAMMAVQGSDTISWTFTGLPEQVDGTISFGNLSRALAYNAFESESLGHVITASPTLYSANVSVAASWAPL